jgi:hypothetical protein
MHEVLRDRIWRRLEVLPEAQLYEVLDYIEFLEGKYAAQQARQPDALQRFAERLEDGMRIRSVAPKVISGTVGVLGTARKVLRTVQDAGRDILTPAPATPGNARAVVKTSGTTAAAVKSVAAPATPVAAPASPVAAPATPVAAPASPVAATPVVRPMPSSESTGSAGT